MSTPEKFTGYACTDHAKWSDLTKLSVCYFYYI